jgi:predicted dehydrogenase
MPENKKIRYAVVGQGYISQIAVLPAFKNAKKNSELVALVSGDASKLKKLGKKYGVKILCGYEQYGELLRSGEIDAVYLALPNHLHSQYAVQAAQAGIHVLCEKPMAVVPEECEAMIQAAEEAKVKLMVAYRLHFEETNLSAIELVKKKKIGDPKIFQSAFTMGVDPKNYRASDEERGGGPVYDIGIYCLNASRYLFQSEPLEVSAFAVGQTKSDKNPPPEESVTVNLKFPGERLASFVCSFGAYTHGNYIVIGSKGSFTVENAYEYVGDKILSWEIKGKKGKQKFKSRDQFAPELIYFSNCILKNQEPEPSGLEGLADVRIIRAIFESAQTGKSIPIEPIDKERPGLRQEIYAPPVQEPELVRAKQPSKDEAA